MATEIKKVYSLEVQGTDSINELREAIEQLNEKLNTLNETSKEYKETLEELTKLQDKLAEAMEKISESAESTSESIENIKDSIEEVADVVEGANEALEGFGNVDSGVIDAFVEGIVQGISEAADGVDGLTENIENLGDINIEVNVDVPENSVDEISQSLENLGDVDVNVNVNVEDGSIDAVKDQLENLDDVEVKVGVVAEDSSIDELKDNLESIEDATVKVNVETDESSIEGLTDTLENLEDTNVSVTVDVNDGSIETLTDKLDNIEDAEVKVNVDVNDGQIDTLNETLDSLEDAEVKVDVDVDDNSIDKVTEKLDDIDNTNVSVNVDVNDVPLDNLTTTLDNLEDTTVSVNVDVNEGSLDNLKDTLENVDDVNVSVGVEVDDSSLDNLTTTLEGVEDTTVSVNVTTDEGSVEDLKDTLENIEDVNVTVGVEVDDSSLDNLTTTLENVEDVNINVGVEVSDEQLDSLSEDITNITTDFESLNSEAEKTSETLGNIGGASTVKELKQQISDLRDRLVTLDKGSEEYKATVQQLIDAQVKLKEVMNAGKNEIQAAEGSYNALSQRMSALKQVWKETTDEATRNEIGKQINDINNQLKALDSSIGNSQRNVGNYKSALDGLTDSYISQKQELKDLKVAMEQMDPSTQEYIDAMARAAEITHNLSEQQEMIKLSSADVGDQLSNIKGIASNLAAGYSSVNAAMGLFGSENEEVAQALLKVQQAMALVQGLQGIDGFIKRTKGLSQSLGLVTKATQANTIATKASATASAQDAAAKGVEATATAGVVPAQLSLNAAMEANPIGFIIGLIAALVTGILLLKDKIMEMIGANENMSKAFDKVKAVLSGFGNVIKKSVINPIKLAIIPIKTLANVMIDLFKGDWSKIADDVKQGMTDIKDTTIDTINVVGAFKEGYDKKTAEQNAEYRKKEAEARKNELDSIIKDNEAKYKSDWKYTEDGKKKYMEYFRNLAAMYDEDSEEYKQALRDKEVYLREFTEHQREEQLSQMEFELKLNTALYGEEYKYGEEYYNKEKKLYDDAVAHKESVINVYKNALMEIPKEVLEELEKSTNEALLRWTTYSNERNDYFEKKNKEAAKSVETMLNNFKSAFKKYMPDMVASALDYDELVDKWNKGLKYFKSELRNTYKKAEEDIEKIVTEMNSKFVAAMFDTAAKNLKTNLDKEIYNLDRKLTNELNVLNAKFNEKKIEIGIKIPDEEVAHIKEVYSKTMAVLERELKMTETDIDTIVTSILQKPEKLAEILGQETYDAMSEHLDSLRTLYADYYSMMNRGDELLANGFVEDAQFMYGNAEELYKAIKDSPWINAINEKLGESLPEFQKLLDERNNLVSKKNTEELDLFKEYANIKKGEYDKSIKELEKYYESETNKVENAYEMEKTLQELREELTLGTTSNFIKEYEKETAYIEDYYSTIIEGYQKRLEEYNKMSEDMELTAEQRHNAEIMRIQTEGELAQVMHDREIELLKSKKKYYKDWISATKDALSGVGTLLSSLSDYYTANMDLEKQRIDQMLEDKLISEETAEEMYQKQEENFNKSKNLEAALTIINGLSGAISAYQSMASIPYVGPFLGAAAAAAIIAASIVNAQKIREMRMDNPYGGSSSSSSTNFTLPDVLETEPQYLQNQTNMNDTDELNNDGNGGRGDSGGEKAVRAYVVESDVSASQELARKRSNEVTF